MSNYHYNNSNTLQSYHQPQAVYQSSNYPALSSGQPSSEYPQHIVSATTNYPPPTSPNRPLQPPPQTYDNTYPSGTSGLPMTLKRHSIMQETDEELTEDEKIAYENGIIDWDKAKNWRFWLRKEWIWYYLGFIVIIVLVALMAFYHRQIVDWLTPVTRTLQSLKVGWLIPIAVLFVISFPPLFGQEIVMVLVGVVWGLGVGFAIVSAGTLLGEVANYLLFKYWCRARAHRLTRKNFAYACLSQAIVDGGFFMAWIVRLSAIPTHFTTAVMAVCGMTFLNFILAAIFSLPKQLIVVYVGVVLAETDPTTNSKVISDSVFGATVVVTLGAMWFIYKKMMAARKKVLISMRTDLDGKHVVTTPPPVNGAYERDQAGEQGAGGVRYPNAGLAVYGGK